MPLLSSHPIPPLLLPAGYNQLQPTALTLTSFESPNIIPYEQNHPFVTAYHQET